jgi:hypothetical protein
MSRASVVGLANSPPLRKLMSVHVVPGGGSKPGATSSLRIPFNVTDPSSLGSVLTFDTKGPDLISRRGRAAIFNF